MQSPIEKIVENIALHESIIMAKYGTAVVTDKSWLRSAFLTLLDEIEKEMPTNFSPMTAHDKGVNHGILLCRSVLHKYKKELN